MLILLDIRLYLFDLFGFQAISMQQHLYSLQVNILDTRGHRSRDHMVVGFTTTYAIGDYHNWCCVFDFHSGGVQHYVIKFVSDLQQVGGFLRAPGFLYQ